MGWRKLAGAMAVAPVWSRDGSRISFYTGNALCSVTAEGAEPQTVKLGRFQWAAPAHSYSPSGQRLAFCKWKSDSRYLAVCSTGGGEPHVYSVTCFHYDWLDEDRLVYNLSSGLRILDLGTGKTSGFLTDGRSLRKLPRFEVQSPELSTALERGPDLEIKNPQVVVDRVFFQLVARVGEQRVEAICSVSQGHDDYRQHWRRSTALIRQGQPLRWLSFGRSAERSRLIRDFQVLDRGAALVLRDEAYDADAKLREWRWLLVSEGSEVELPHGCVPAFRPCGPEFGVDLLPLSN
jgi:hypothetical protein